MDTNVIESSKHSTCTQSLSAAQQCAETTPTTGTDTDTCTGTPPTTPPSAELYSREVELPLAGLPSLVRKYIDTCTEVFHCPREFVMASVFTTAATAVGKKLRLHIKDYTNFPVLWMLLIAPSGSNKSYPMKMITSPLRSIDKELYEQYLRRLKRHWGLPKKDRPENEPKCRGMVVDNCTDERRDEILFLNSDQAWDTDDSVQASDKIRSAIGIYPEVKTLIDGMAQQTGGLGVATSRMLKLFDCEPIKIDRKTQGVMLISEPMFNIIGDIQPSLIRSTFSDAALALSGFNQRFLFCVAERTKNPDFDSRSMPQHFITWWDRLIRTLYTGMKGDREVLPQGCTEVYCTPQAEQIYADYYNLLQAKKSASESDYESSVYAKLQIHALRLATVIHALKLAVCPATEVQADSLQADTMAYAVACMDYFEHTALRVMDSLSITSDEQISTNQNKAEKVRRLLKEYPDASIPQICYWASASRQYVYSIKKEMQK